MGCIICVKCGYIIALNPVNNNKPNGKLIYEIIKLIIKLIDNTKGYDIIFAKRHELIRPLTTILSILTILTMLT